MNELFDSLGKQLTSSGQNERGIYLKLQNGIMICANSKVFNVTTPNKFNNSGLYYGSLRDLGDFAEPFIDIPKVLVNCFGSSDVFNIQNADASNITKSSAGKFYPIGTGPRDVSIGITVAYIAIGHWK